MAGVRATRVADQRELAAIVESSNDAIIGKTLTGTITSWNAAAERHYGYSTDEMIGRSIEILEPEEKSGEIHELLARLQQGERIEHYKTARRAKNGDLVRVSLTISPIHDDEGEIVGASSTARDIGERLRAEAAVRQSEENYRQLFEAHPEPMWVFDAESLRFLAVNQAAVVSYGYTRSEFLGMTIKRIRPAEDEAALERAVEDAGRGYVDASVWRHRKKDGSLIDVVVTSNTLEFNGRPARLVLARDVTDQRRLAEHVQQSQKMEAIGRLAGGIAHDFNNLLLVIRGYCAFLLKRLESEELRSSAQQIESAAQRAGEFTQQLLAFSRQQVLHLAVTDVNEVVEETLRLLERTLGTDLEVTVDLDPGAGSIVIDRSQLTQAVLNLAINARQAMPDGGTLSIRTGTVEFDAGYATEHVVVEPGTYALLQITDNGPGMDEETRERAFEPFFTTKEDGTGLGLATVYGLVKQTGGYIWLYSELGFGTTFKLYFPRTAGPVPAAPPAEEPLSLEGSETVLVVEDAEMVRTLVATTLESYGYKVIAAAGGAEAIELAENTDQPIDLVLTDVVMPGMNGRELAEHLRAKDPSLRVLFTSGYPADSIIRHGIADESAAFIEKPYLPEELALKVRDTLERPPSQ